MDLGALIIGGLTGAALASGAAYLWWRSFRKRLHDLPELLDAALRGEPQVPVDSYRSGRLGVVSGLVQELGHRAAVRIEQLSVDSSHLHTILGSMSEGVLAVDSRLRVTFCNSSFARAVGIGRRELGGESLLEVVRDTRLLDLLKDVVVTRRASKCQLTLPAADGRSFEVNVVPLTDKSTAGAVAILYDSTELDRLERVRKDFVANVSHEIRTPLAAIQGYIETLLDGALDDDPRSVRPFLGIIDSNARRLTNIAADLLVLATLESDSPAIKLQTLTIGKSIESAIRAVHSVATDRGVRIIVSETPDVSMRINPTNLDHALLNLLDNAVKFNRPDGEVHITVTQPGPDDLRIEVRDTGVGIPSEEINRIFERFYRVDKARSKAVGGTGLGLSIVKHAVEQMGGTITVTSQLGRGSCFVLTLPIDGPGSSSPRA